MFLQKLKHKFRVKITHGLLILALLISGVGVFFTQNSAYAEGLAHNIIVNDTPYAINTNPSGTGWKIQGGDLTLNNFDGQSIEVDGAIRITLKGNNKITQKIKADGGKVIIAGDGTLTVDHQQRTDVAALFKNGLLVESGKLVVTNANYQVNIKDSYTALSVDGGLEINSGATVETKVVIPNNKGNYQKALSYSGLLKVAGSLTTEVVYNTTIAGNLHAIHAFGDMEVTATGAIKASSPDKAITMTPGKQFLLADGVRIASPKTHRVSDNKQTIVPYVPNSLEIKQAPEPTFTISKDSSMINGDIQISPTQAQEGQEVQITAQPQPGYKLKTLSYLPDMPNALEETINGDKFNMPRSDVKVKAEFKKEEYTVTVGVEGAVLGGIVVTPVKPKYDYNEPIKIEIAADPHHVIKSLKKNGQTIAEAVGKENHTVDANVTENLDYKVEFESAPTVQYQLTVNCGVGGTCTPNGVSQYNAGAVVTITLTPETGKRVKTVTGATKVNDTTYTVVMNSAKTVAVEFELISTPPTTYNITKGAMTHGDITLSKTQAAKDEEITIAPQPALGYKLKKLTYTPVGESAVDITSTLKFTMPEKAVEVNAEFEPRTFTLTINCGAGGACTPSATGPHTYGTEVTITLTPEADKKVKNVTGATKITDTTYKVTMDSDKTVAVEFENKTSTPLSPVPGIKVNKTIIDQDQEITVSVENLTTYEGQELDVWLQSNPRLVGKMTVLAGKASLKFKIPCDVTAGAHTIYVKSGNTNVLSRGITVSAGRTCSRFGAPNTGYRPAQISAVAIIAGCLASLTGVVIFIKKRA
ncbi:MAG: hypothetical protein Q3996_01995 [Candidatus Saccharibacteria bacterium]|nr:hypothetical protein [Candidatus Saccharibacteria bacterium]